MKTLLLLILLPFALVASSEAIELNLDASWQLIHDDENIFFKIWEKENERIIVASSPWDQPDSIENGITTFHEQLPPGGILIIHNQTDSTALVEWTLPGAAKTFSKFIYTPESSNLISYAYLGDELDSIDICNWLSFFENSICLAN